MKTEELQDELIQARLEHSKRFAGISEQLHQTFLHATPAQGMELDSGFDNALRAFHETCSAAVQEAHSQYAAKPEKAAPSNASAPEDMPAPAQRDIQAKQAAKLILRAWRRRELFNERERSRMSVAVGQTVDLLLALHSHDADAAVDALWALQDAEKQTIHELELVEKSAVAGHWGSESLETPPEWLREQLLGAGLEEAFQCDTGDKSLFCCQSVMQNIPDDAQDQWLSAFQPPSREQAADKLRSLVSAQCEKDENAPPETANNEEDDSQSLPKRRRTGQAEEVKQAGAAAGNSS